MNILIFGPNGSGKGTQGAVIQKMYNITHVESGLLFRDNIKRGMLSKTADFYDQELEVAIGQLVALFEPLMIVVMAVIIGFIVIAMMLPMFDMLRLVA